MPAAPVTFVQWFRSAAPYIHTFRGKTFVIAFGGEVVAEDDFIDFVHDLNLLNSLGVRLVLVHGARPQIEAGLALRNIESRYAHGLRVTDRESLACVLEASGRVRNRIEALLSMGLANSPMAGAGIRVAGGNYVTAKPLGVIEGVDMQQTGEVRKIDAVGIQMRLDLGEIVLLSALGYSPTGETFNLALEDVATQASVSLKAQKLVFMMDSDGVFDAQGVLQSELSTDEAEKLLSQDQLSADGKLYLPCAIAACRHGVARAHLISRHRDGSILLELFTRDGIGTMVTGLRLSNLRPAKIDDVGGLLALIQPLEEQGVLVRRSRELLEMEIERFHILEHDNAIIGCAALYRFPRERAAELAGLAVHPDYRNQGYGEDLLRAIENQARKLGLKKLFVLTTRTAHWFLERGFKPASVEQLPKEKRGLYNWQRRSQVYEKAL
ncbi:amino-acid N-acetyltransferase [Burkholderiales bacterium]|nr:MAG: amino-acid N-acetyltransferase [Burkholderiales bacterium]CAG0961885.1 amino-acid N-acetyltransferase [Burkholderiales bacterium]